MKMPDLQLNVLGCNCVAVMCNYATDWRSSLRGELRHTTTKAAILDNQQVEITVNKDVNLFNTPIKYMSKSILFSRLHVSSNISTFKFFFVLFL